MIPAAGVVIIHLRIMSPVALTVIIAVVAGVAGVIVFWVQRVKLYRTYEEIGPDARQIATRLKAEVFRDGNDLVISGSYRGFPSIVRFSHSQNTPGMNIQMRAPASFDLSLSPKKVTTAKGRTVVRTGNVSLDTRFSARTDHPTQVKMIFNDQPATSQLEKLCCSSQTEVTSTTGNFELSELAIPTYPARHGLDHVESREAIAGFVQKMPGAEGVKVEPMPHGSGKWLFRGLAAAGAVTIVVLLLLHPGSNTSPVVHESAPAFVPDGMAAVDATRIPRLQGWRVFQENDFRDAAAQYLRNNDLPLTGHVTADFSGDGGIPDSAYLLRDAQGRTRVSMMVDGVLNYDAVFPHIDVIAGIPKANLQSVKWVTNPEFPADGDGLLIIQDASDPKSGVMLMEHANRTFSARPADFTKVSPYPEE